MRTNIITMDNILNNQKQEILRKNEKSLPKTEELRRLYQLEKKVEHGKFLPYSEIRELKILSKKHKNVRLTNNQILEIKFSNRRK